MRTLAALLKREPRLQTSVLASRDRFRAGWIRRVPYLEHILPERDNRLLQGLPECPALPLSKEVYCTTGDRT